MPIDTSTTAAKAAKFENVGDKIEGVIISAEAKPQTDIETGEVRTWANGQPIIQWVITLDTDQRDDDDDNDTGERTLYAKGGKFAAASGSGASMMEAIKEAVAASGARVIEEGGTLAVAHTGLGEKRNKAYSAPKLYKARYTPPAPKPAALDPFAD